MRGPYRQAYSRASYCVYVEHGVGDEFGTVQREQGSVSDPGGVLKLGAPFQSS